VCVKSWKGRTIDRSGPVGIRCVFCEEFKL